ncbi:enoyl-CoA hydratase/isomerase family protein [Haliangium ochraceum]|uniref:Enoyl-CoA hydratase/isomerase n=1 Tax=Haliangium ochraceum (strain DSM 14365 / JCM 11303 / SMP-2) TaxID=502025 RepID=D0LWV8_HALO1|nr:enoyl-CoA hydratase/isomerase family protein [Haliangium ochraceum]ACY14205.1 Enoyl-CoA hydratase/isomerase [Haliangium ochraceum DSM 14365]
MSDSVHIERHEGVALVTMALPHKRNALTAELYPLLARRLEELQRDSQVRAIVLSGGEHFCAGGDLSALDLPAFEMRRQMHEGHRVIRAIIGGERPVLAAVQGNAFGAGLSLAMACDFVIADENTSFCAAFGRVGLTPDYGLLWTLPQRVGMSATREIVMFCEPVGGARAHELGMVDRLCEPDAVPETALALAQRLAQAPPATLATTKRVLARLPMPLDTMLAWEADTQSLLVRTDDFDEGVQAFRERRPPRFRGQ